MGAKQTFLKVMAAAVLLSLVAVGLSSAKDIPRIDSVVISKQPHESDEATIWYDDFDGPPKQYTESNGKFVTKQAFGGKGKSMLSHYEKGDRGKGGCKVFFGDSPTGKVVKRGNKYDEVYWRIYIKHQYGWTGGGPAKMSRATSIAGPNWRQAMISHVWGGGENLTLDPASGIKNNKVVTQKYNDFDNLSWLGNQPGSKFKIHSTKESGRWVCVEARAKLNTPGQSDGHNQLWIDGRLEAERKGLDWRGSYDKHGINAVFLESYWNSGSPVTQSRWMDNFVISTKPIGPVVCPRNPILIRTPYHGSGKLKAWEVEAAADDKGKDVVWKSNPITTPGRVKVEAKTGEFVGDIAGKAELGGGKIYYFRVRQQNAAGRWSPWSAWHQPIMTEG